MKVLILAASIAVILCTLNIKPTNGSTVTIAETNIAIELAKISPNSLVPLSRHARSVDIFDATRGFIQTIITNLRNAANATSQAISSVTTIVNSQTNQFLSNLNISLSGLESSIQTALTGAVNTGQVILISVMECTDQQQIIANRLIAGTVANITMCVTTTANEIVRITSGAAQLAANASQLASNISNQATACGVADLQNFFQVGDCLNNVVQNSERIANALVGQLISISAQGVAAVTSAPTRFGICAASKVTSCALAAARIVVEIGQCTSNAIASLSQ